MKKISVVADSTSDLPSHLIEKYNIKIIPLHIHLDDQEFSDGIDIDANKIFEWSDANKKTPQTASFSINEAVEALDQALAEGEDVICFTISQTMSSSYQVLKMAIDTHTHSSRIRLIDSANLSSGIGLLALKVFDLAEEGKTADQIVEIIEDTKDKVRSSFVLDTLEYLRRGGRCSSVEAFAGMALKLHPKIEVENGKMAAGKKYRGKINVVLKKYVNEILENLDKADPKRVFITSTVEDEALIEEIKEQIDQLNIFEEIIVNKAGSVISSHCGPGTLGILYIEA